MHPDLTGQCQAPIDTTNTVISAAAPILLILVGIGKKSKSYYKKKKNFSKLMVKKIYIVTFILGVL